jgi:DNA-binding IclR family transcriptional regulator
MSRYSFSAVTNRVYGIESVENALRTLSLLAGRQSVGVSEVAGELGIAPSSAHRLLVTLRTHGFATQDSRRRYHPGPALGRLHHDLPTHETLRRVLRPHLGDLAARLDETVHLVVLDGVWVRFLDSVETSRTLRVTSRAGVSLPAHTTSGGKALLAELAEAEIDDIYQNGRGRRLANVGLAPGDIPGLRRALIETRRRRYGVNLEESEPGIIAVGACVRTLSGDPVAALSASVPAARLPHERIPRIAAVVLDAARRASTAL